VRSVAVTPFVPRHTLEGDGVSTQAQATNGYPANSPREKVRLARFLPRITASFGRAGTLVGANHRPQRGHSISPLSVVRVYLSAHPQPCKPLYSRGQVTLAVVTLAVPDRFRLKFMRTAPPRDRREARS
jgi:hypothetical protein